MANKGEASKSKRGTRSAGASKETATAAADPLAEEKKPVPDAAALEDTRVYDEYLELCKELNLDSATTESAWESYAAIKQNYTLEGNPLHWLACAVYVACHNSQLPTVGGRDMQIEGNGVSLTRLLRCCKLSLIHFFNKAKKWADMSNLKSQFRSKIDCLERNFAVSNVIFKKYQPIFVHLFKDPAKDPPRQNRSRKLKKPPCTPGDVFDFCWCLFVRVKTDFPSISDDLVNSYHLLLSCVDYIYGNAVMANRFDLLNEAFKGHDAAAVAEDGTSEPPTEPPCILDELCKVHDGIISEVKSIREHWWKPHIKKFFSNKILRGDQDRLSCILDSQFFETNAKNVKKDYESYVLSIGEYDERVFLGEDANDEIGTPSKLSTSTGEVGELGDKMTAARRNLLDPGYSGLIPITPLSGKHYLRAKEQLKITPVSTATYLVSRLNALLRGPPQRTAEPSSRLLELFAACDKNPTEAVMKRVEQMGDKFCQQYTSASDQHPGSHESFARLRLKMGVILYYKLLEAILYSEKEKKKPLANLLEQDIFHQALFTCCLEIVIFSYNSQRTFPWILETFALEPIHFYKVIEVIIRIEDSLPRDVVKHLQRIEEQILESRAWTRDSPLWAGIEKEQGGVPSCEEVSLPGHSVADPQVENVPGQSPLSHHKRAFSVVRSPMAADRFKSPVVTAVARRQLAFGEGVSQIVPTSPVKAGQSVLSPQKTVIQVQGQNISVSNIRQTGDGKLIISSEEDVAAALVSPAATKPKRTGSLGLFFRKFYHLAHLRMDLLCHSLQIHDEDVQRKIWTTFEYTIMKHPDLMKDRHLDQLLMCSLYIVCKVVGQDRNFTDVMRQYKTQPQAASHVYRSVLLGPKSDSAAPDKKEGKSDPSKPPPTPTKPANASTVADGEERGDLIKFYNDVFMHRLQEFGLKFKRSRQAEAPPLSPLPKLRVTPQSPCRKVSENHSVFIRPLKQAPSDVVTFNPSSPHKPLSYSFSRSPAKDLAAINALMRNERDQRKSSATKRLLPPQEEGGAVAATEQEILSTVATEVAAVVGGAPQTIVVQDAAGSEPPIKVQIVDGAAPAAVNSKLGLVLGDRN